jgi:glycosyl transferase family 2
LFAAVIMGLLLATLHGCALLVVAPLRGWRSQRAPRAGRLRLAVIVPCCGELQGELTANLLAIAGQRRLPDRLILVAREQRDSATPIMKRVQRRFPFVHIVFAGAAGACCQKNRNLLAGLAHAGDAEILVFADSDIRPGATWLDDLVEPLEADPSIGAASALCAAPAADGRLLSAMQALFTLHTAGFQRLGGLIWGGSVAVRVSVFAASGVAAAWARTAVDDLILWKRIRRHARVVTLPALRSGASARPTDWRSSLAWNVRQYQYSAIYFPVVYAALVAWELLAVATLLGLPVGAALGVPPATALAPAVAYLTTMTALDLALLSRAPGRSRAPARAAAALLFPLIIIYVALVAWRQRELIWAGIAYRMDDEGNVESVELRVPELQGEAPAADTEPS